MGQPFPTFVNETLETGRTHRSWHNFELTKPGW